MEWYNSLAMHSSKLATSTISPIWTILYPIILVGFAFVRALTAEYTTGMIGTITLAG